MKTEKNDIIKVRKGLLSSQKKKRVKFRRQSFWRYKRLKDAWRRPKGRTSKMRLKKGGKLPSPTIGHKNPDIIRHLHPSGYEEIYVSCVNDLENINPKTQGVRFSGKLGKKKKQELLKKTDADGIKVFNR